MNRRFRVLVAAAVGLSGTTALTAVAPAAVRADTTDLIFSEYVEGSSNNKALEIYNGTGADVPLAGYTLELYSNGSSNGTVGPQATLSLTGTIADGDVYVIAHPLSNATLLALADLANAVVNHNGDDGLVLKKDGVIVDAFGQYGVDPGTEWAGGGQDETLVRSPDVCAGDVSFTDAFTAATEWTSSPIDTFSNLGAHTSTCTTTVTAPTIDAATPADASITTGSSTTLSVTVTGGSEPFSYQWYQGASGDTTTPVGTDPTFTTPALPATTSYWVRVGNSAGSADSRTAVVTVTAAAEPPQIDQDTPADATIAPGTASTLAVEVTGTGPLTYQWYQGTVPDTSVPVGTNSPSFTTPNLTADTSYWVRVTNEAGTADSRTATITMPCGRAVDPIGEVQGPGSDSPCVNQSVTIEGIVVGDYEGPCPSGTQPPDTACALRGFYVQSPASLHDDDPLSSEAIFVFHGSENTVNVGDELTVTGTVAEFQGQTQLGFPASIDVVSRENQVAPTVLSLPMASPTEYESYEGMLVTFEQTLYVTETFHMARSGEVRVSAEGRRDQPTAVVEPGEAAIALQAANNLNYLVIDDATNTQNPDPYVYAADGGQLTASNTLRGGDTVTGATGVMTFGWAGYNATGQGNFFRLRPQSEAPAHTAEIPFVSANPRPTRPPNVGGSLRVVGFNVLNYFRTLDTTNSAPFPCGPIGFKQECRGANSAFELQRQHDKLIAALLDIDADVYGFAELENSHDAAGNVVDPLAPIVDALNEALGDDVWSAVDTGIVGTDTIRVGLIYRNDKVELAGDHAVMDSTTWPAFDDDNNRPSLAVPLRELATGGELTVVVNHWKSKGSCPTNPAGPQFPGNNDTGDGSSCWNAARVNAAESLLDWLATNPTGLVDDDVLVFGDLNSYAKEAPIDVMTDAGYVDAVQHFDAGAYSYVFDGQWGTLDYALASPSLAGQLTGAADYHINADEPPVLDYNTDFKTANNVQILYSPDEYRTSDHDPAIVGMALDSDVVTVTVEQASGQPDPAARKSDVRFTVTFSEPVVGFGPGDLVASGGGVTPVVSGSGATYTVTFPKVNTFGRITLSVAAGAATDADGNVSLASTSVDNSVFVVPPGIGKR